MATAPSVSYSITVRLEVPASGTAVSQITTPWSPRSSVTGLDVTASGTRSSGSTSPSRRPPTARRRDRPAAARIEGVTLARSRPYVPHAPRRQDRDAVQAPIRNRDDLSMIYTRVSPACAWRSRRTPRRRAAHISALRCGRDDGSAVLGSGHRRWPPPVPGGKARLQALRRHRCRSA